jgi:Domain of unknown function (DUF4373)
LSVYSGKGFFLFTFNPNFEMAKNAYYFPHDFDPAGDPKMQAMLGSFGGMGYGIFWRIVEMLHADESHKLKLKKYIYEAIAKQMLTTPKQVEELIMYCIETAELFLTDGESIWSNRVFRNIDRRTSISEVRSEAGKRGAIAKQNIAKERKGKEKKGEESSYPNEEEKNKKEKSGTAVPEPQQVSGFNYLPDGRSYIEPTVFFTSADFNGLPEANNKAVALLLKSTKNISVESVRLDELWEVFKVQELTFQKPYRNREDVFRHFGNWTKKQSFSNSRKTVRKNEVKDVFGEEFINDFSQCRMNDGTVVDLSRNEKDLATYGQINPNSIKRK